MEKQPGKSTGLQNGETYCTKTLKTKDPSADSLTLNGVGGGNSTAGIFSGGNGAVFVSRTDHKDTASHTPVKSKMKDGGTAPQGHTLSEPASTKGNAANIAKSRGWSSYLLALRPWSFTASLTPVGLGSCLAYKILGSFDIWIVLLTCVIALSVHAAGNLVNTYFDYMKGVDSKKSDDRTLVDNILAPNDVATMGAVCYCVGCAGFVGLVWLSPASMEHLALIYFGGLSSSFLYTGGLGLKYIALGDILIFLSFGPVTVLFAYLSQGGQLSFIPLLYAMPLALNTAAILHSNNTRDMQSDKEAGIVTLAIVIGKTASYAMFAFLLFTPYLVFVILAAYFSQWFLLPAVTVFRAFEFERMFREGNLTRLPQNIAKLNLLLGTLFTLAITLSSSQQLPGCTQLQ